MDYQNRNDNDDDIHSDVYIFVKGTITVVGPGADAISASRNISR